MASFWDKYTIDELLTEAELIETEGAWIHPELMIYSAAELRNVARSKSRPFKNGNNIKGDTNMNKTQQRTETMKAAGIDTGKYFSLKLTEGLKPGASITLVINEEGVPVMMDKENATAIDFVREEIFANGYVKNTKLHRRWVMAHMFRMLNYKSWDERESGYDAALRYWHGFDYQFKVIGDELRALAKLEESDKETFLERVSFFNKKVVLDTCNDYMGKLTSYIDGLKVKHCKGVPYKRIKGRDIFVADLNKKVYTPLRVAILRMVNARTYADLEKLFNGFMQYYIALPHKTPKCKEWKDAFKGAGSFYTLKNLIMYHDCYVTDRNTGLSLSTKGSMEYINKARVDYHGEYWRLFALMKKVITDNHFDFNKRMKEIYK